MIGAAVSDLHLGYRAFPTRLLNGRNAREQDVEAAWVAAVDRIVAAQPGLVTIAGDVFDHVKPDFHAVRAFMDGIETIVRLTDAHVVIIPGNHCMPRTAETLTPNCVVAEFDRVHLVTSPLRLRLSLASGGEDVSIACFPFVALEQEQKYSLDPDPSADVNVLLMHAAVKESEDGDSLPFFYGSDQSLDVGREAERWDVIAVGDYHEYRRLHPKTLAFYSGSIERTSSNIWPEKADKGVVIYDTHTGHMHLEAIPTRPVIDLALFDVVDPADYDGLPPAVAVNAAMQSLYEYMGGEIVRLSVGSFPRSQRDDLDRELTSALKKKFFHFQLEFDWISDDGAEFGDRRGRGRTFEEEATEYFQNDEPAVRSCAMRYLGLAAA